MTQNQKDFADEWIKDHNATRAYMKVYKNVKSPAAAAVNGSKLLNNANVQKYIESRLEKIQSRRIATVSEVHEFITKVMRGEELEELLFPSPDGEPITMEHRSQKNQLKAAEMLVKIYERTQPTGDDEEPDELSSALESLAKEIRK